jgi:hypothetical protein
VVAGSLVDNVTETELPYVPPAGEAAVTGGDISPGLGASPFFGWLLKKFQLNLVAFGPLGSV